MRNDFRVKINAARADVNESVAELQRIFRVAWGRAENRSKSPFTKRETLKVCLVERGFLSTRLQPLFSKDGKGRFLA
jgi:hypothetical protein